MKRIRTTRCVSILHLRVSERLKQGVTQDALFELAISFYQAGMVSNAVILMQYLS